MASIAASGWLRTAWIIPLADQALAAFGLSARARSRAAAAIATSPARKTSVQAASEIVSASSRSAFVKRS
jgi:hypothetical protein